MDSYKAIINGGQIPNGTVQISGAKNSATKLLAAALICDENIKLCNFPTELVDVKHKIKFIKDLGGQVEVDSENDILVIDNRFLKNKILESYDYFFRTTYLLVPSLLKKSGEAIIPYPGGCKIGQRGFDLHIDAWKKFGAEVYEENEYIKVVAKNGLQGTEIDFPISTIGGTETALICSAIANGKSVIKNAYISPEVNDLISFIKLMGAEIKIIGNSIIEVIGKEYLTGCDYSVMPDRIEAITWIVYGVLSGGSILIKDVPFSSMQVPLLHLKEAGIDFYRNDNNIYINPTVISDIIRPFELATGTHPGIISDMQPFFVLLAIFAKGNSKIFDYRYPERTKYCEELNKFHSGIITYSYGKIEVLGSSDRLLIGTEVNSTDLRGSMALLIASLLSKGISTVNNVDMALRGYNKLEQKLLKLGIKLEII